MKNKRRIGLFILCLGLACITMNNTQVSAKVRKGKVGDNITWKIEKGVLTLSGKGKMKDCGHDKPVREDENKDISCTVCDDECEYKYEKYKYDGEIQEIVVEEGITGIGAHAFREMDIKKITIASTVETIGHCAFEGSDLEQIIIPDSVVSIGESAFESCIYLKSIQISKNLKTIPVMAFFGCYSLKEIDIPDNVRTISRRAFMDCLWLRKVNYTANSKLKKIGILAFDGCNIQKMIIPSAVKQIDGNAINCSHEIIADKNNPYFSSQNGVLFSKDKKTLICYPNKKKGNTYRVPKGVQMIESFAFCRNEFLKKLIMSDTITTVKEYACLAAEELKTVQFSKKLKSIGKRAFDCGLTSLKLPNSLEYIGENALNCKNMVKIVIPKNVKKMGRFAFFKVNNVEKIIVKSKKIKKSKDFFDCATGDIRKKTMILPKSKKKDYQKRIQKQIPKYYKVKFVYR